MKLLLLTLVAAVSTSTALIAQKVAFDPAPTAGVQIDQIRRRAARLTVEDAHSLEKRIPALPNHLDAHLELAYFWLWQAGREPSSTAIEARRRHVLWVIGADPRSPILGARYWPEAFRSESGKDSEGLARIWKVWERQLTKYPLDKKVARGAAVWIEKELPELAFELYRQSEDRGAFGEFCGLLMLGHIGGDDPPKNADSPIAEQARHEIASARDAAFLYRALATVHDFGSLLYHSGAIRHDYTDVLKSNLPRLAELMPESAEPSRLSAEFPPRRNAVPTRIRVGGYVQEAKLTRRVRPVYPSIARQYGVEGTVALGAVIAADGRIKDVQVSSGPGELVDAAVDAVKQWRYAPTLINGVPCEVVTRIDIRFSLQETPGFRSVRLKGP